MSESCRNPPSTSRRPWRAGCRGHLDLSAIGPIPTARTDLVAGVLGHRAGRRADGSLVSWRRGTISTARATSPTRSILGSRKLPKRASLRAPNSAQRVGVDLLDACQEPVQCPLRCCSRDRLSGGGSGEGMAVGRQLVTAHSVDVGGEHHPAIDGQFVQDGPFPSLPFPGPWGCLSR